MLTASARRGGARLWGAAKLTDPTAFTSFGEEGAIP
jgi:hypothetical protein